MVCDDGESAGDGAIAPEVVLSLVRSMTAALLRRASNAQRMRSIEWKLCVTHSLSADASARKPLGLRAANVCSATRARASRMALADGALERSSGMH